MVNEIHLGDCLDILKNIPDRSIDLVLVDPPYGCIAPEWDKIINMSELWKHYNRIIKSTGTIAIFSSQPFTTKIISSNEDSFKYCWYWIKNQCTNFFHAKRMPTRRVEEICIFGGGLYNPQITHGHVPTRSAKGCSNGNAYHGNNQREYAGGSTERFPNNVLDFKCVDNYSRLHVSEKPVELLEYLIKTYTDDGGVVIDNCMGSGSTGVACMNTGRKFIGIEKDSDIFVIAEERMKKHKRTMPKKLW